MEEDKIADYKCPICGSEVRKRKSWRGDYCTKDGCPYDTSD